MRSGLGGGGGVNAQMSGWLVKDQRSLKSPRKLLICYLTLSGKIAATAMDNIAREAEVHKDSSI